MKTIITKKHEYLSGWTSYNMVWKTEFTEARNKTLQSIVVITKEPFSAQVFKNWAAEKGYDICAIFTNPENIQKDCETANQFIKVFNEEYVKNIDMINSDNKCHVEYSASINPNYHPIKTAFETFHAYDVKVRIEFKSGVIETVFFSQGREKNSACTRVVFTGKSLKAVYGEEEAIETIKSFIGRYIDDCDTDEKFQNLPKILTKIQKDLEIVK